MKKTSIHGLSSNLFTGYTPENPCLHPLSIMMGNFIMSKKHGVIPIRIDPKNSTLLTWIYNVLYN